MPALTVHRQVREQGGVGVGGGGAQVANELARPGLPGGRGRVCALAAGLLVKGAVHAEEKRLRFIERD
eukprot:scaffold6320_cov126-Isochrysis_galbana.AAC.5